MITQVHPRGTLVAAALRRAFASDPSEPPPQIVAAWDGTAGTPIGGFDTGRRLATMLAEPLTSSLDPPTRPVWRCTIELDPAERRLTVPEWSTAVRDLLAESGIAPHGDRQAVRWVAVGHGNSRVHIVATLVRQDGRIEAARDDRNRCAAATRNLERRLGLQPLRGGDGSAEDQVTHLAPAPDPTFWRDDLCHRVRAAAITAVDEDDFFVRLRAAGLGVRLRPDLSGSTTGYAVSCPVGSDRGSGRDRPRWFGGGQLAADLSLPYLRRRWAGTERADRTVPRSREEDERLWQEATEAVRSASAVVIGPAGLFMADRARGVVDLLTVTAVALPAQQAARVSAAAELLYRAVGHGRLDAPSGPVARLRSLARLIGSTGEGRDDAGPLRLVHSFAGFAYHLGVFHRAQQQRRQAAAAFTAAGYLREACDLGDQPTGSQTAPSCVHGGLPTLP
ncbi:hypothetical protein KZZ52_41745 [Dactylosporangium sp. AC04546]|uniref:hypothetical protein n=1 Tax=Dactylosporangium sp. AC04546 TaxID=2862460 RepID=UPI001EE1111C|nr:hypothetical protein [Dactylosporangium sp. AC04546]WVK80450.1 hypothetical protein KZZ52_41745 [Dactylosporangium sp. AC04546]